MPHTHHSHSGQFCGHAKDTLAEVLHHAFNTRRMTTVCMTEHVSRTNAQLYESEAAEGTDSAKLQKIFDDYVTEAKRLQDQHYGEPPQHGKSRPQLLLGFESEWIPQGDGGNAEAARAVRDVLAKYPGTFDLWVGSVHHVLGEPIDYDRADYERARDRAGGSEVALFNAYFDAQRDMLEALRPPVVGHFDLIRLLSDEPDISLKALGGSSLWAKITRNLEIVKTYGGVLELNSSGKRKGMAEPYPMKEVVQTWTDMGGHFVLSDDSHGVAQVGACYTDVVAYLAACGVKEIAVLQRGHLSAGGEVGLAKPRLLSLKDLMDHTFFQEAIG